ncbi:MAG: hypothetical protein IKI95_05670, partial [Clostridia bacterium]|nr:hypothetical protein [Clostridia bacterium]
MYGNEKSIKHNIQFNISWCFCFVLVWGITNFNKVQEGLSGTGLYTQEDLNKAYEDGYDKALTDKAEYEELINSYRDT